MVAAVIIAVVALALVIVFTPRVFMPAQGMAASLAHALRWDVLMIVWLAASIGMLARHRFFTPEDIDGSGLTEGTSTAKLLQSILQNTLEQTALAFPVYLIWAATMPWRWQAAVPMAAILFFVGRLLFWKGYSRGAPARSLGFALTFYPSVIMLIAIIVRLIWGLIAGF